MVVCREIRGNRLIQVQSFCIFIWISPILILSRLSKVAATLATLNPNVCLHPGRPLLGLCLPALRTVWTTASGRKRECVWACVRCLSSQSCKGCSPEVADRFQSLWTTVYHVLFYFFGFHYGVRINITSAPPHPRSIRVRTRRLVTKAADAENSELCSFDETKWLKI